MDIKQAIDQLREEFKMAHLNNTRVMEIIDTLYQENQELKRMMTMKFKDIDDETWRWKSICIYFLAYCDICNS